MQRVRVMRLLMEHESVSDARPYAMHLPFWECVPWASLLMKHEPDSDASPLCPFQQNTFIAVSYCWLRRQVVPHWLTGEWERHCGHPFFIFIYLKHTNRHQFYWLHRKAYKHTFLFLFLCFPFLWGRGINETNSIAKKKTIFICFWNNRAQPSALKRGETTPHPGSQKAETGGSGEDYQNHTKPTKPMHLN